MLRAYDDGVAYRLRTALPGPLRIRHEEARFVFPEGAVLRAPLVECRATPGVDCFRTSFEETYTTGPLASFDPGRMAILPVLVEAPGGPKVVITEADLDEYPGLWLSRAPEDGRALRSVFAGYPLEAMRNAQKQEFRVVGSMPMSQGTRVHQLAVYVVYESPWQKMGGNVSGSCPSTCRSCPGGRGGSPAPKTVRIPAGTARTTGGSTGR